MKSHAFPQFKHSHKDSNYTINSLNTGVGGGSSNQYELRQSNQALNIVANLLQKKSKKNKDGRNQTGKVINATVIVKEAQRYFDKNPAYIKENEVGDINRINLRRCLESTGTNRIPNFGYPLMKFDEDGNELFQTQKQNFSQLLIGTLSDQQRKSPKKPTVNFNFELNNSSLPPSDLPFKKVLGQKRKEDRILDHVMKCFTFGKRVRRQVEDEAQQISRVQILKTRFQRLELVREYFSVKKKQTNRKFKNPLTEDGLSITGKVNEIYDDLQYCQESDVEELKPQKKIATHKSELKLLRKIIKERHQSLDLEQEKKKLRKMSRLDIQILKNLNLSSDDGSSQDGSDNDTFKDLDDESQRSIYSSPRERVEQDFLAVDRVMPFDFVTHRRAKAFFKEKILDLDTLVQDREITEKNQLENNKYEDEVEQLREIPEMSETLQAMLRIKPRRGKPKKQKKTIKGEMSSSSDDERFDRYNFASKVQNTQIRDNHNELLGMFFQRSQGKNLKYKRQMINQIATFKQSMSPDKLNVLQNRQFVIVDSKSLHQQKVNNLSRKNVPDKIQNNGKTVEQLKEEYFEQMDKKQVMVQHAKNLIMKQKQNFSLRKQAEDLQKTQAIQIDQTQEGLIQNKSQTSFAQDSRVNLLKSDISYEDLQAKASPQINVKHNDHLPIIKNQSNQNLSPQTNRMDAATTQRTENLSAISQLKINNELSQGQSMMSSYTNFAFTQKFQSGLLSSNLNQMQSQTNIGSYVSKTPNKTLPLTRQVFNQSDKSAIYEQTNSQIDKSAQKTYSQGFSLFSAKLALRESPYTQIEVSMNETLSKPSKYQRVNQVRSNPRQRQAGILGAGEQTKIRGFLAEKLRRKSVLNCELFKISNVDYKQRVNQMLENIDKTAGTNLKQARDISKQEAYQ
eukprot:403346680